MKTTDDKVSDGTVDDVPCDTPFKVTLLASMTQCDMTVNLWPFHHICSMNEDWLLTHRLDYCNP